ncbi:poly(A) RNA polymerase, mitochondrial-like [Vanessa atalanta]|uniref:poly(A) RNA polymerase, mitochondrial-like n=1 Tax=Vanessa atalanta TaxID=42275 RepID=UPI001FCCCE0C|nr:poly(A) RNA polymerase, mitochondrial-like [Vanessa atalanta]
MSVLLQTSKCIFRKPFNNTFCKYVFLRKNSDVPKKFITFDEVVAQRRAEAMRSVVVQVNSDSSFNELYGYCSKYASIKDIHHYKNTGGEHFMVIEFASEDNLKDVLKSCSSHNKDHDVISVQSPFLWFRAAVGNKEKFADTGKKLAVKNGTEICNEDVLLEDILNCETVSDQIQLLYERTTLNDLSIRLRYIVARQLEMIFNSLYTNVKIQPFGSSVNGFGRMGCDLDLVLINSITEEMGAASRRLVFQEKRSARQLELAGALLELRVAGVARLTRILNARVPIVKYAHEYAGLHCDLCYNNSAAVHMSELLWQLGELCARSRALAVLVRRWAAATGLTQPHPGRWLTNFPLTLMVLFFLQRTGLLPSLNRLVSEAGKEDIRIAEENVNCTFLRDLNKLPADSYEQNDDDLQTLLFKFFEFYSQFDFQEKAISINEGKPIRKPNSLPLYIVNPLEQSLNVSRNVSYEECERLRLEVRNAAWHLESCLDGKKSDDWGILGLIEKKSSRGLKKLLRVGNSHRLVSMKDLFTDNDNEPSVEGIRSKMQKFVKTDKEVDTSVKEMKSEMSKEQKSGKIKFKNNQTASAVYRIRRDKII